MLSRRSLLKASVVGGTTALAFPAASQEPAPTGFGRIPDSTDMWEGTANPGIERAEVAISVGDSPLPNALDMYYSFLRGLVAENGLTERQKVLLNNTIIPLDISQDTPFYNEGLFRSFADRVFVESPQSLGPANRADRFSLHYEQVIRIAASTLDRKYKDILAELKDLEERLDAQTEKLTDRILKINDQWLKVASGTGLTDEDPSYELKYINFLEAIKYADQVNSYSQNIDMIVATIDAVRRSKYEPHEQLLLDNLAQLSLTRKVARPKRPHFERQIKDVTELTFADPTVRVESIMDISPAMWPLGDLVRFLQLPGQRQLSINKTSNATHQHDKSWSGSGSFGYKFFSLGGSASGSSSHREDIKKAAGISVSFENIAEYLIDRELWFNPAIFKDPKLQNILNKIPNVDRLEYVAVSLIIARGLTLQLTFEDSIQTESWSKKNFAASGGVSVMGFGFKASGNLSTYDYSLEVSTDGRTVTFRDDPQLTRVLGVRLEKLIDVELGRLENPPLNVEMMDANSPLAKFLRGETSYLDLQSSKFSASP